MHSIFTPAHHGGSGPPLVCLHGFMDTWRIWELVLPELERHHEVLAPTLPGHAGGPALEGEITDDLFLDAIERTMDVAGFGTAHIAGNSLGGYIALRLAARGRAQSVVAFAPAGGFAAGDETLGEVLGLQSALHEQAKASAPHAEAILASAEGRRRATRLITTNYEHIPVELLVHQMLGVASCKGALPLIEHGLREGYSLDAERIDCPVRIVWGTDDRLLPWPSTAARYLEDWLPHADWVELEGVGHCPPLDVPVEAAQLIVGLTAP